MWLDLFPMGSGSNSSPSLSGCRAQRHHREGGVRHQWLVEDLHRHWDHFGKEEGACAVVHLHTCPKEEDPPPPPEAPRPEPTNIRVEHETKLGTAATACLAHRMRTANVGGVRRKADEA